MSELPAAAGTGPPEPGAARPAEVALLASVFVVATCGLLYELVAAALASWLLGDSVLQFSTIIGAYLFAMGIGSYLSRFVERALMATFLRVELLVGVIGGTLPALLFVMHNVLEVTPATSGPFRLLLYALVLLVGTLVGLEIPLVMRILKAQFRQRWQLSQLVSQVLTFDYLGALAVAVAFPLVLLPQLGAIRTGTVFGLLNVAVAAWAMWLFRRQLVHLRGHVLACAAAAGTLLSVALGADRLTSWAEARFYGERIVHAASSPYQRIVVTAGPSGQLRLFLNGNLQFDSRDEHRYHEALVHPAMAAHGAPRRVAILGGGDGLALREVLRYPSVEQVWLVDLDAAITQLFAREPRLRALNAQAFDSPRVRVVNTDAFTWLESHDEVFDVVIVDFPDPSNFSLGKLYTTSFYALLEQRLAASGYAVVQATSPLVARRSFWTVVATLEAVGLGTTPYHAYVPSFGEWGFVVASRRPWRLPEQLPEGLRFVTREGLPAMLHFPPDMARVPAQPNRITEQSLVHIFEQEWGKALR